jgi:PAS domain S-box-containing protein
MARSTPASARDWLTQTSIVGSGLLVLVGAAVLAGGEPWIDALLRIQPVATPMRAGTAASILLLGAALLGWEAQAGRLAWIAAIPAGVGFLVLSQRVIGWAPSLEEIVARLHVFADPGMVGPMPGLSAMAILIAGTCLLWFRGGGRTRFRPLGGVLGASLTISIGMASVLARVLRLSEGSALHPALRPGLLAALSFVLLGGLLLSRIWRDDPDWPVGPPDWLPVPVVGVGVTLTLFFAAALSDRESAFIRSTTQLAINNVATVLNLELDGQTQTLQRMAARWMRSPSITDALRDQDGAAYRENFPALRSLAWIGAAGETKWVFPIPGNEYLISYDHGADPVRRQLIQQVQNTGRPAFSGLLRLPLGGRGFLTGVPLPESSGASRQVLLGEFSDSVVMETVRHRLRLADRYAIAIDVDGQRTFESFPAGGVRRDLGEEAAFNLSNQEIRISLAPSEATLNDDRRFFPELFTALGLGLSLLLGAVAHLARTGAARRRAAETTNAELKAEIAERQRAEQALHASQAATRKLSLVASSTDNLVAILDAAGRLEWVNESFVRLFNISPGQASGREFTALLIGPAADPAVGTRLKQAIDRAVSFNADVTCHARVGLSRHLHLDLQPVRSETGAVTNFIAILVDITARVETEQNLRHAKEEADAASRSKSEFLASMSHEIRTPMNGVIGMASLLLETPLTPDQRECVNTIRTSGDSLVSIINDILDFSKIESGRMELEQHPFELAICVEEALDLFAVPAAAKRIDLAYVIAGDVPSWILGDVTRLRQIIVNLVNNAIKFTPQGYVSVEVSRTDVPDQTVRAALRAALGPESRPVPPAEEPLRLAIAVRDSGIGIPAEKQHRLFRPFSQVDSSTTRKYGGTGLGLAICRRLAELMGGTIEVASQPGRGSVFTVVIPIRPVAPQAGAPLGEPDGNLRGRLAWVIDDHEINRRFLTSALTTAGLSCVTMESAQAARVRMKSEPPPALLIIDQLLPDGEGRHLARELRDGWRQPRLPLMLLLPAGEPLPGSWLKELAPAAHLLKPMKSAPLLITVRSLLNPRSLSPAPLAGAGPRLSDEIPLRILLVEDNPVNRNVALGLLARLGYQADSVINGMEAVTAFGERQYDLVMMDLQMPRMDGLDASRELRRRLAPERQPRIIAVTANAVVGDRETCLAAGMNDYLAKPLRLDSLSAAIRRNCQSKTTQ